MECYNGSFHRSYNQIFLVLNIDMHCLMFCGQIQAVAKREYHHGDSSDSDPRFRISDVPAAVFGSRAHLEEKALATVMCCLLHSLFYCCHMCRSSWLNNLNWCFQRKWYRNFLMKGFHLVVLMAAGPGICDTQAIPYFISFWACILIWYSPDWYTDYDQSFTRHGSRVIKACWH